MVARNRGTRAGTSAGAWRRARRSEAGRARPVPAKCTRWADIGAAGDFLAARPGVRRPGKPKARWIKFFPAGLQVGSRDGLGVGMRAHPVSPYTMINSHL